MRKVEEIKYELEREKDRMNAFLVGSSIPPARNELVADRSLCADRPDLEPHRYFHEVRTSRLLTRCPN
jgi:hypothetical protein